MSKKINIIFGLVAVAVFFCFIYCRNSNSAVFELQKGEAEALGVVFQEGEDLISKYDKYMEAKEYDKAIVVAKKMGGYHSLQAAYVKTEKYEEALLVNQKLIKMGSLEKNSNDEWMQCMNIMKRAMIFEEMNQQNESIKVFEKYRKYCPEHAETFIPQLEEAISKGEKLFPVID